MGFDGVSPDAGQTRDEPLVAAPQGKTITPPKHSRADRPGTLCGLRSSCRGKI